MFVIFFKILRGLVLASLFFYGSLAWAATVEISEVAWMGSSQLPGETTNSAANREWIELFNSGAASVDLSGWILIAEDGTPNISLSDKCTSLSISANSYFLLERTDDESVPGIAADCIYTGALSNGGEVLILRDAGGTEIDRVDGSDNWAVGGSNETKETLQKVSGAWQTLAATPKAAPPGGTSSGTATSSTASSSSGSEAALAPGAGWVEEEDKKFVAVISSALSGIAGADFVFEGRLNGENGKEVQAERYFWNFGDGGWKEGKKVAHAFVFPGKYLVSFTAKILGRSVTAYREIEILPSQLLISEVKPGRDAWLELFNSSLKKLNIAGWILRSGTSTFIFPEESHILPQTFLVIPRETSRLAIPGEGQVELLYPNGSVFAVFLYAGAFGDNQSFQRDSRGLIRASAATPAAGLPQYASPKSDFKAGENHPPLGPVHNQEGKAPSPNESGTNEEVSPENQTALLSRFNFSGSFYSWALLSLGVGLLAALGFVASRRL